MKILILETNSAFSMLGVTPEKIFDVVKEKDLYYQIKEPQMNVVLNFPKQWAKVVLEYAV